MKKRVVSIQEVISDDLHGGLGTRRALINEDIAGAKHFSLFLSEMQAGAKADEHSHPFEQCWYILSGHGKFFVEGEVYAIGPEMALFAPINASHKIEVDEKEPLRFVIINAPPSRK